MLEDDLSDLIAPSAPPPAVPEPSTAVEDPLSSEPPTAPPPRPPSPAEQQLPPEPTNPPPTPAAPAAPPPTAQPAATAGQPPATNGAEADDDAVHDVVLDAAPAAVHPAPPPAVAPPAAPEYAVQDVVLTSPPPPAPAATRAASNSAASEDAVQDVVLRSGGEPGRAGATSLQATVEIIETTQTIADLKALLQQECVAALCAGHTSSVNRCVQYVAGLAKPEEVVLAGFPVLSINEWGTQQLRTLVLTSHALYRLAFYESRGAIDHFSRTSLGALKRVERGRYAFKLMLTEPDGRENPFTYFWSAYVKQGTRDSRYERVYYPLHPPNTPIELAMACLISALHVANRLLCDAIGSHCYVSRLTVADYVPDPNVVDEWMDRVVPQLERMGSNIQRSVKSLVGRVNSRS